MKDNFKPFDSRALDNIKGIKKIADDASGRPKSRPTPVMKADKELYEILDKFETYCIFLGSGKIIPKDLQMSRHEAKAAIQSFIDTRVREGRIDEVRQLSRYIHLNFDQTDKVMMRLAKLSKEGKQND